MTKSSSETYFELEMNRYGVMALTSVARALALAPLPAYRGRCLMRTRALLRAGNEPHLKILPILIDTFCRPIHSVLRLLSASPVCRVSTMCCIMSTISTARRIPSSIIFGPQRSLWIRDWMELNRHHWHRQWLCSVACRRVLFRGH